MSSDLAHNIKQAINDKNITKLYEYKDICDRLHSTGQEYKGFTPEDLPSDSIYELMCETINDFALECKILTQTGLNYSANTMYVRKDGKGISTTDITHRQERYISDLWMGSITKLNVIKDIKEAFLLPKFDGCSCGVKLRRSVDDLEIVQAVTRGIEQGFETVKSDITDKLKTITDDFLAKLNDIEFTFANGKQFKDVTTATIRGEIVLKDAKTTTSSPAAYVAGKINGYMDVWMDAKDNIEFIPFEIMRLYFTNKDDIYVPTQSEVIEMFESVGLVTYEYDVCDLNSDVNPTEALNTVVSFYKYQLEHIGEPIDGVVYMSIGWKYPLRTEDTKPKSYGKYAWKPTSETMTVLNNISYTLARDGTFTFILEFNPVNINGKKYKQAKTATSRMLALSGMGIGSSITVKLAGDISPMVVDFQEDENITPYELPSKCPCCGMDTQLSTGKTQVLRCVNKNCKGVLKQKMMNFLKLIGIKGIAEGKLNTLRNITFESVVDVYLSKSMLICDHLNRNVDTKTFLIALGIGGKTKVEKMIPKGLNPTLSIMKNYESVLSLIRSHYENDPFVKEVMDYVGMLLD